MKHAAGFFFWLRGSRPRRIGVQRFLIAATDVLFFMGRELSGLTVIKIE